MGIAIGVGVRTGGGNVELDPNSVSVLVDDNGDYLITDEGEYLGTRSVNDITIG